MSNRRRRVEQDKAQVARISDFSGGLNTTISRGLLNSNEAVIAQDISYEQKGTIIPRRGIRRRYATPFSVNPCTGAGVYYKKDGTSRLIVATGDSVFADKPHIDFVWDDAPRWQQGVVGGLASVTATPGDLVLSGVATTQTQTHDTQAQWNAGTHLQTIATEDLTLAVEIAGFNRIDTTKAHFDACTRTNVSTTEIDGSVVLARG